MSNQPSQPSQGITISLDALMTELAEARKYIEALESQINQLNSELVEIVSSRELISELNMKDIEELIAPADRRGHIMVKVVPIVKDKVITHIGLEYYVELPLDKAVEVLSKKESDVKKAIEALQSELSNAVKYYRQLQAIVNAALAQARGVAQK
ncbi:MAG: prefoldin subunit alpha [Desulfurococcales archaeon]|nr:prefoldin subunit alpha [Desulfurococcales archaeon]